MKKFTVDNLIKHCDNALGGDWQYIFGGKGQILSREQIIYLQNMYGKKLVPDSDLNKAGRICCDCSGLISSLVGGENYKNSYWFRENAIEVKSINERNKDMKGWAVYKRGHIGVFDGENGYYAMDNSRRNMVHNDLSKNNFTEIIKLSDIEY